MVILSSTERKGATKIASVRGDLSVDCRITWLSPRDTQRDASNRAMEREQLRRVKMSWPRWAKGKLHGREDRPLRRLVLEKRLFHNGST